MTDPPELPAPLYPWQRRTTRCERCPALATTAYVRARAGGLAGFDAPGATFADRVYYGCDTHVGEITEPILDEVGGANGTALQMTWWGWMSRYRPFRWIVNERIRAHNRAMSRDAHAYIAARYGVAEADRTTVRLERMNYHPVVLRALRAWGRRRRREVTW